MAGVQKAPVKELKVEDALLYLDQVKSQFGDQPAIYNQFLEIMKNFKAQSIDTPGVIKRVSTLFKGYPKLILGFNTFLPPGFKIKPEDEILRAGPPEPARPVPRSMPMTARAPPPQPPRPPPPMRAAPQPPPMVPQRMEDPQRAARSQGAPVEFDHAIHYVTTIKKRFADQPEVYKSFLEILHTYQKEQRSIDQVLEQVSELFRDHPDLLREFTYFLPDAVQEQAKERLSRAAQKAMDRKAEAEMKKKAKLEAEKRERELQIQREKERERQRKIELEREREREKEREKEREREREARRAARKARRKALEARERRGRTTFDDAPVLSSERRFFEQVKASCATKDAWHEFLKVLDLFAQEIISKQEMMSLVADILGSRVDLKDEFARIMNERGTKDSAADVWYSMPLAEIDLSQCRRCTPSYRGLPASYPTPPCSERSELEKSICNDEWVSVPTGSEDFSFKNMRKNQYEEALFKCEDERFEIDMVIDTNMSAIRVLEPLLVEINYLKDSEKAGGESGRWQYRLDKRTLGAIHLNAISRVYGEHGNEVLDLLRKNPAGAIPVILARLKQKDEEWRRARQDLNKQWKEVLEKNFHKSLDHRSFYFKQQDKKTISNKTLLAEAMEKLDKESAASPSTVAAGKGSKDGRKAEDSTKGAKLTTSKDGHAPNAMVGDSTINGEKTPAVKEEQNKGPWKPHFIADYGIPSLHRDVYSVLTYAAEHHLSQSDKERVARLWREFLLPFLQIPTKWLKASSRLVEAPSSAHSSLAPGTEVETPYGEGTVSMFRASDRVYVIDLPFGVAYVQPCDVLTETREEYPISIPVSDDPSLAVPVPEDAPLPPEWSVFYGNENAYIFFRLLHLLYERLHNAKEACDKARRHRSNVMVNPAARAFSHSHHDKEAEEHREKTGDYHTYLTTLYALLDGSMDNPRYEDSCRSLMGTASYMLFTMDKLVHHMLKHLQVLANDEICQKLQALFWEFRSPKDRMEVEAPDAGHEENQFVDGEMEVDEEEEERKREASIIKVTPSEYLERAKATLAGERAFRIQFHCGVRRLTPVEPSSMGNFSPSSSLLGLDPHATVHHGHHPLGTPHHVWMPSPRVRRAAPNPWLVTPSMSMSYLGVMEEVAESEKEEPADNKAKKPDENDSSEKEEEESGASNASNKTTTRGDKRRQPGAGKLQRSGSSSSEEATAENNDSSNEEARRKRRRVDANSSAE